MLARLRAMLGIGQSAERLSSKVTQRRIREDAKAFTDRHGDNHDQVAASMTEFSADLDGKAKNIQV